MEDRFGYGAIVRAMRPEEREEMLGPLLEAVEREHDLGESAPDRRIRRVRARGPTAAAGNRAPGQDRLIEPGRENAGPKTGAGALKRAALMFARE